MNTKPKALIVSGKKGAGKDTLSPLIIERLGVKDPVHVSFADALKDEIDNVIHALRGTESLYEGFVKTITVTEPMPRAARTKLVRILFDAAQDPAEHARSHSAPVVEALQYYGTDVRRAQDPDYWVKIAVRRAAAYIKRGKFPYFTDARFPNEVTHMQEIGALAVRLDVSPEEQARRLRGRDGRVPTVSELSHASETSLDDFDGFDVRVCADHSPEAILDAIFTTVRPAA